MTHSFSEVLLSQLSQLIAARMGLDFPRERWRDLERGIRDAARDFDFEDARLCLQWMVSSPWTRRHVEILARHLTVGETYFFREKKSFESLEDHILPELVRARRGREQRLRIWSAGCSTGEEPYSIAILLSKVIGDLKDWNITILATDLNPHCLQKASEGIYSEWSFRETPQWFKQRYFKKTKDGRWAVLQPIKKMVTFACLNLAEDAYPSLINGTNAMDVVFCRNLLMYLTPAATQKVIQNLYCSLAENAWLIVSLSETSHILFSNFLTVNLPGVILYRKLTQPSRIEVFPYEFTDERTVSFHMTSDSARKLDWQISTPQQLTEPPPPNAEEKSAPEPQVDPYGEALDLYERGRYEEASEKIQISLSGNQSDAKAMALLASIYANLGKLAEALDWCEEAIAADKMNAGYHYLRATILQEQGSPEKARASLRQTLYLDPDFLLAYFALGNLALREAKFEESEKYFENARSLLGAYQPEEVIPESGGITAARLMEIITAQGYQGTRARR